MPNCDFYALADDARRVLDFVFEQPSWILYELASRSDSPLRHFTTTEGIADAFDLANRDVYLNLYTPDMRGRVHETRITFNPDLVRDATYRYDSRGWGLIQLYLVAPRGAILKASHTNHMSEVGARRWELTNSDVPDRVDDWDWQAVQRTSARLNRFIRGVAPSKFGSRPILPAAHEGCARGHLQVTL